MDINKESWIYKDVCLSGEGRRNFSDSRKTKVIDRIYIGVFYNILQFCQTICVVFHENYLYLLRDFRSMVCEISVVGSSITFSYFIISLYVYYCFKINHSKSHGFNDHIFLLQIQNALRVLFPKCDDLYSFFF